MELGINGPLYCAAHSRPAVIRLVNQAHFVLGIKRVASIAAEYMKVAESTAGEVLSLICQKAVLDPAPFATWPSDMRRTLGDTRNIQFTFYYY